MNTHLYLPKDHPQWGGKPYTATRRRSGPTRLAAWEFHQCRFEYVVVPLFVGHQGSSVGAVIWADPVVFNISYFRHEMKEPSRWRNSKKTKRRRFWRLVWCLGSSALSPRWSRPRWIKPLKATAARSRFVRGGVRLWTPPCTTNRLNLGLPTDHQVIDVSGTGDPVSHSPARLSRQLGGGRPPM